MQPILLTAGGINLPSYGVLLLLALIASTVVRSIEVRRLGYLSDPKQRWVGLGALVGAVVGSKIGMMLFLPWEGFVGLLEQLRNLELGGKTVLGGLAGGYLGVELAKKLVGITTSTGDGFALAIPVGQAIGRVGCFLHGCCYGAPWDGPWAVRMAGAERHPVQLYESGLDLMLAVFLFSIRRQERLSGHLFRYCLIGYAFIRVGLEWLRGDEGNRWGLLSAAQIFCLVAAAALIFAIIRDRRLVRTGLLPGAASVQPT